jgi:solute carrier family 6 GABA transporter-like protein 6/8/11/12/13
LQAIWIFSWLDYRHPTYNNGEYSYPAWAITLGWVIASSSLVSIPAYAVHAISKAEADSLLQVGL